MTAQGEGEAKATPSRRRRGWPRWGVIGVLATTISLLVSGCTLWANQQFVLQGGITGFYAYIGTNPSSQIQDVHTAICRGDANCTTTILSRFNIGGPSFVKQAWLTAWTHSYTKGEGIFMLREIAYNRWVSGGQRNTCLVLWKPTIPFPSPWGGPIVYRWQTRALGNDGCVRGQFAQP